MPRISADMEENVEEAYANDRPFAAQRAEAMITSSAYRALKS